MRIAMVMASVLRVAYRPIQHRTIKARQNPAKPMERDSVIKSTSINDQTVAAHSTNVTSVSTEHARGTTTLSESDCMAPGAKRSASRARANPIKSESFAPGG